MLGKQDKPHIHVKAGEARGLLGFCEHLLEECRADFVGPNELEGYILLSSVQSLNKFEKLIQSDKQTRRVSQQLQLELMAEYNRFLHLIHRLESFPYTPKNLLYIHSTQFTFLCGK
jgi:hypothetical protein